MPKENGQKDTETSRPALIASILYTITFITSIPGVFLLDPILMDSNFVVSFGTHVTVIVGAVLDLTNAIACGGTAYCAFLVIKKQSESAALGYLFAIILEAATVRYRCHFSTRYHHTSRRRSRWRISPYLA